MQCINQIANNLSGKRALSPYTVGLVHRSIELVDLLLQFVLES